MFSQLAALMLAALSFASAAPSRQQAVNAAPQAGTYQISTPKYGPAAIRSYTIGQALYASRTLEFPGPFGLHELTPTGGDNFQLKNVGLDSPFVSTSASSAHEFYLEESAVPGYFIVHTADGSGLVWTLNPEDGPVVQRIILASANGGDDQLFRFSVSEGNPLPLGLGHLAAGLYAAHVPAKATRVGPVTPGAYYILDGYFNGMLRSYTIGQNAYTSIARDFPGDFGVWIVKGDDSMGYTITNAAQNLPLVVTGSKNLATIPVGPPAQFTFSPGSQGRVSIASLGGRGVWGVDPSQGPVQAQIQIQPQNPADPKQEFAFAPVSNLV
ncbi:unnamed protein product [Mycena citricolor]|uniref:Uncharacterized protein n=1 Tax=Mycena citricolor TaxID=2018698 RepID=A0AAD2Q7E2_9AGAR|nr:unnamed protein product [Mycena citricolor]